MHPKVFVIVPINTILRQRNRHWPWIFELISKICFLSHRVHAMIFLYKLKLFLRQLTYIFFIIVSSSTAGWSGSHGNPPDSASQVLRIQYESLYPVISSYYFRDLSLHSLLLNIWCSLCSGKKINFYLFLR